MAKILVLGNEQTKKWSENINDSYFIQMPVFSLGEDGERKLCEFVIKSVGCDCKAIVIDVDEISKPEFCLAFAMTIRLSILDIKSAALTPILFISRATQDILTGYKYSPIILTGSVAFDLPENVNDALDVMEPLSPIEYKTKFLDIIKIIPNATEGRHSLANQWGADVLSRMVIGSETNNELIKKARLSLYFKYVRALSLSTKEIETIINGVEPTTDTTSREVIDATGKKILLIDDEADKGWYDVLCKMLPNSVIKPIKEQVPDYDSLSDEAKKEIKSGKYDLFFLDLRMNGVKEEDTLSPNEFSGMKILNAIKEQNRGNQVIMFTASNKAWNMKALLDAGADGYYIKESPEFAFPHSYSLSNAQNLCNNIRYCLSVSSEQRNIWESIKSIKRLMDSNNLANKYFSGMEVMHGLKYQALISTELDVVWGLIRSNQEKKEHLSMLSLFKILEFMNEFFYKTNNKGQLCLIDSSYKELLFWENGKWLKQGDKSYLYRNRKIGDRITKNDIESTTSKVHNIMKYIGFNNNDKSYSQIRNLGNERNGYIHAKNSATKSKNISLHNIEEWINAIKSVCSKL